MAMNFQQAKIHRMLLILGIIDSGEDMRMYSAFWGTSMKRGTFIELNIGNHFKRGAM